MSRRNNNQAAETGAAWAAAICGTIAVAFVGFFRFCGICIVGFPYLLAQAVLRISEPAMDYLIPSRTARHGVIAEQITPVLSVSVSVQQVKADAQKPLHSVRVQSIANEAAQSVFDSVAAEILQAATQRNSQPQTQPQPQPQTQP